MSFEINHHSNSCNYGKKRISGSFGKRIDLDRVQLVGASVASSSYSIVEGVIWNPKISGKLLKGRSTKINTKRGRILEWKHLGGNNTPTNYPKADIVDDKFVVQIKTISSKSTKYIKQVARKASRDAVAALGRGLIRGDLKPEDFISNEAKAKLIFRSGTKRYLIKIAREVSVKGAQLPDVIVGLPGILGKVLKKGLLPLGLLVDGEAFINDFQERDIVNMLESGSGLLSGIITTGGIALSSTTAMTTAAVVGTFSVSYSAGRLIDEWVGLSDKLSDSMIELELGFSRDNLKNWQKSIKSP